MQQRRRPLPVDITGTDLIVEQPLRFQRRKGATGEGFPTAAVPRAQVDHAHLARLLAIGEYQVAIIRPDRLSCILLGRPDIGVDAARLLRVGVDAQQAGREILAHRALSERGFDPVQQHPPRLAQAPDQ